ncbi:MAG: DUF3050 domain-containing protein [Deltaproteobacteria bacterium]|nr:DUF3050 domain-containing protein [Deltaproteobacteria bacterium]
MVKEIDSSFLQESKKILEAHPVYQAVSDLTSLRCFMEHHVYSVWDFMSLLKYLQSQLAPSSYPWLPHGQPDLRRFINQLVLEEESDETNRPGHFSSHFELYQEGMKEVGAEVTTVNHFIKKVQEVGIDQAFRELPIPEAAKRFSQKTFAWIQSNQPHCVAAAFAFGREHIIPGMFRTVLERIGVDEKQAPIFYFYLKRHIHLDEDFHAPLALKLLDYFCGDHPLKQKEALKIAEEAVQARLEFWDGVLENLRGLKN